MLWQEENKPKSPFLENKIESIFRNFEKFLESNSKQPSTTTYSFPKVQPSSWISEPSFIGALSTSLLKRDLQMGQGSNSSAAWQMSSVSLTVLNEMFYQKIMPISPFLPAAQPRQTELRCASQPPSRFTVPDIKWSVDIKTVDTLRCWRWDTGNVMYHITQLWGIDSSSNTS